MRYILFSKFIFIFLFVLQCDGSFISKDPSIIHYNNSNLSSLFNNLPSLDLKKYKIGLISENHSDFNPLGGKVSVLNNIVKNMDEAEIPIMFNIIIDKKKVNSKLLKLILINKLNQNLLFILEGLISR